MLMKTVGLLIRPDFEAGLQAARQIIKHLEEMKLKILLPPHLAKALKLAELTCPISEMKADFVITLGGDGTTLYAARHLPSTVPILPVNLESFGFLSECEADEVNNLLNQVLGGELAVQETPRLGVWSKKRRLANVVNEVAFFPAEKGRPVLIRVHLGEAARFDFRADGFVIATPMGSTGHALSLGGPILDLQLDAVLLIAAAPLRNSFRSLVVPNQIEIQVQLDKAGTLYGDGDTITDFAPPDLFVVAKIDQPLRILRRPTQFYTRLQQKLLGC